MTGRLVGYGQRAPRVARRRAIVFSILLGISMILMIASATAPVAELQRGLAFALAPFTEAVNGVGREVRSVVDAVAEIDRLRRENEALASENGRLEERNRTLEALAVENEQLTALLAIRNSLEHETVATRVIARELADVSRVVMIDAGSEDGLEIGDVVIGAGGALAGRVTELGMSAARVTLINDPASTVIGEVVVEPGNRRGRRRPRRDARHGKDRRHPAGRPRRRGGHRGDQPQRGGPLAVPARDSSSAGSSTSSATPTPSCRPRSWSPP